MNKVMATFAAVMLFALGFALGWAAAPSQSAPVPFPCAEDEVLGYSPEFGADRVGCIHRERLVLSW